MQFIFKVAVSISQTYSLRFGSFETLRILLDPHMESNAIVTEKHFKT